MSQNKYIKNSPKKYKIETITLDNDTDLTSERKVNKFSKFLSQSKSGIILPALFIALGGFLIYKEIFSELQQSILESTGYYNVGSLSPVDDDYVKIEEYISNPDNLSQLTNQALNLHILEPDSISSKYTGIFYISIPSLGINKLPIRANVDSTSESSYLRVLNQTLAHFQGTGLPISNVKNNIVVYGHSASLNYNPKPSDPMVAFSLLPNLKVGDEIIIEIEGKTYTYKMYRSKIVEPNDTEIITGTKGRSTLTLFTCFPLGSDEKRYIAIARPA